VIHVDVPQVSRVFDWRDIMKTPPDHTMEGHYNYWFVFEQGDVAIAMFEMMGPLPPHRHPATHWATVLKGEAECVIGDQYFVARPWDTIRVDIGVPHVVVPRIGQRWVGFELTMPRDIINEVDYLTSGPEFERIDAIEREHGMWRFDVTQNGR
jgi:mannose-6-phosphate isomerase-like protein (cupin superfamily)